MPLDSDFRLSVSVKLFEAYSMILSPCVKAAPRADWLAFTWVIMGFVGLKNVKVFASQMSGAVCIDQLSYIYEATNTITFTFLQ